MKHSNMITPLENVIFPRVSFTLDKITEDKK